MTQGGRASKRLKVKESNEDDPFVILHGVVERHREHVTENWEALDFSAYVNLVTTPSSCSSKGLSELSSQEVKVLLSFFVAAFRSLEDEHVRGSLLKLVSLPLFASLSEERRRRELNESLKLKKYWNKLLKREKKEKVPLREKPEATFFPKLHEYFVALLLQSEEEKSDEVEEEDRRKNIIDLFLQFVIEILGQLPTRRFVRTFLSHQGFVTRCRRAKKTLSDSKLLPLVEDLMNFEVDDHDGSAVSDEDMLAQHYEVVQKLQRMVFRDLPKLQPFALANCKKASDEAFLRTQLSKLDTEELRIFVTETCCFLDPSSDLAEERECLEQVVVDCLRRPTPRAKYLEMLPMYPTEDVLFDEEAIPESSQWSGRGRGRARGSEQSSQSASASASASFTTGLPRMNLQFLTMRDYLMRNFKLLQLEATYEIREDIMDVLPRMGAHLDGDDQVKFSGWARMASRMHLFSVVNVGPANLGEEKPSHVHAEVQIDLAHYRRQDIRNEWDAIKQHDVLFLVAMKPTGYGDAINGSSDDDASGWHGMTNVRGCEVIEIRDEKGKPLSHFKFEESYTQPNGTKRTLLVAMDPTQYHQDTLSSSSSQHVHSSFNLLVRRGAKESNFKAVLESIRDLAKEDVSLPPWLQDVFLGYGDPAMSHFTSMPDEQHLEVDFRDTFLDAEHLKTSFPGWKIDFAGGDDLQSPFFKAKFSEPLVRKESEGSTSAIIATSPGSMVVEPYEGLGSETKRNAVKFTEVQASAILSGMQKGLTMIVGPPGTGKTDVATQILELLYHNHPNQRILLITHSNQALNDLFMKIMNKNVPARYLLRLGMGEQELETDLEFSRLGRVNAMLDRRLRLLSEVERISRSLDMSDDYASTCETCSHFWLLHIKSRWEHFLGGCKESSESPALVSEKFPFKSYFENESQTLFPSANSNEENMRIAQDCFHRLEVLFSEIEECRPFELLHRQSDRLNYLMTKQAKIVAMTCTYAAMKRSDFIKLGLQFDSIVMEESAQVLDIEALIPMQLQKDIDGQARLKRVVLIGDHNQLPPVVKNMTLRQTSNLEQSLFTRLIRLGTPYIELNAQGRSRPSIAGLYNWKYNNLGNLSGVNESEFLLANAGFKFDYQFIDVGDYNGQGENAPTPHFIQNLGEAEYAVTLYQHMRLLGYPASKITILTTYNGQKALLKDVVERRCAYYPLFGRPAKIETVDRFQGQQNDFVILSLVRTKAVGHIRDARRLVVALSRARLGLFVMGRKQLFASCLELKPTFDKLLARPTELHVIQDEVHPTERKMGSKCKGVAISMEDLTRSVVEKVQQWEKSKS